MSPGPVTSGQGAQDAQWGNDGHKGFKDAQWGNDGHKGFKDTQWGNDGHKGFKDTQWGNDGHKGFKVAQWTNLILVVPFLGMGMFLHSTNYAITVGGMPVNMPVLSFSLMLVALAGKLLMQRAMSNLPANWQWLSLLTGNLLLGLGTWQCLLPPYVLLKNAVVQFQLYNSQVFSDVIFTNFLFTVRYLSTAGELQNVVDTLFMAWPAAEVTSIKKQLLSLLQASDFDGATLFFNTFRAASNAELEAALTPEHSTKVMPTFVESYGVAIGLGLGLLLLVGLGLFFFRGGKSSGAVSNSLEGAVQGTSGLSEVKGVLTPVNPTNIGGSVLTTSEMVAASLPALPPFPPFPSLLPVSGEVKAAVPLKSIKSMIGWGGADGSVILKHYLQYVRDGAAGPEGHKFTADLRKNVLDSSVKPLLVRFKERHIELTPFAPEVRNQVMRQELDILLAELWVILQTAFN